VNKTAARTRKLAKCILLLTYSRTTAARSCASTKETSYSLLTS